MIGLMMYYCAEQFLTHRPTGINLTYAIFDGVLVGQIGGRHIHILAASGGGGGSTIPHNPKGGYSGAHQGEFYPYLTGLQASGATNSATHRHGGPLPIGRYRMLYEANHPHLHQCVRLIPQFPSHRSGFLIHGRGPHGSDGCIVPIFSGTAAKQRESYLALVHDIQAAGSGDLHVVMSINDPLLGFA